MVTQGIVLGHVVSSKGIEVDPAKISVIQSLLVPKNTKDIRAFLGHAGFYRRFIKDFSKIVRPLTQLLLQDAVYDFNDKCMSAFENLKKALISAPIMKAPDWSLPFELMCDASDYAVGAVLGQRHGKDPSVIYYARTTLNGTQRNYTTTEKEMLAIVFSLDKFRSYLVGNQTTIFTDHAALKYLLSKKDTKQRLIRWVLLLQEFDLLIKDKKDSKNVVAYHLSRIIRECTIDEILDTFPDVQLLAVDVAPWYAYLVNYLATDEIPDDWLAEDKKKFKSRVKFYFWDDPYLFKYCIDQVIRRCVPKSEHKSILAMCHYGPCGGHFLGNRIARKILDSGFYWPTIFKDAHVHSHTCEKCQLLGNPTLQHEIPQHYILVTEIFDVWGIDFMGPFPSSHGYLYILFAVDYVSKWIEAIHTRTNDQNVVINFLKTIFTRFGVPKAIIIDQGIHFYNRSFQALVTKYGVVHRVSTPYHPQTNDQAKVSNRQILEKTVNPNKGKNWSERLDDALWAFHTAYKTPIGTSPYRLVYGKPCHLPIELEHRSYWALKKINFNFDDAVVHHKFQLSELEELRSDAYNFAKDYKVKTKKLDDSKIQCRNFEPGQQVLLFNSRLKLISGKFKTKWTGPFEIISVAPHGAIEIKNLKTGEIQKVNGNNFKPFLQHPIEEVETFDV